MYQISFSFNADVENNLCNEWHMSFHQMTCHKKKKIKTKGCIRQTSLQDKNRLAKSIVFLTLGFVKENS